MNIHDGSPLIAKTIHLQEQEGQAQIELTNGEMVIWTGTGALAIGRQLAASVRAGQIRTFLLPSQEGSIHEVHVGPDVAVVCEDGLHNTRRL